MEPVGSGLDTPVVEYNQKKKSTLCVGGGGGYNNINLKDIELPT